ncbi:hypothetical protein DAPPUDRAFT_118003 [Daphnia pulex]|uniref:Retrotransposon gag domain-containing protein n=1 Tax=Daphnia pulex TaxID=6669 RepID=E9HUE1_DAPPU|nr:hypothetical protein DAPPUDRAFT_118003 [Daphnia pulex]|eukprot:EFX64639.1 hypothetical protein DAPPUDRAFT_118003 [Daphnia pulex]
MADQEHGQHEDAGLLGRGVEQMEGKDPPIFRGLPNEDVMEWIHQFQRVSVFHQWGAQQQLRHIEFSLEGVAERWLSGLDPRPNTIGGLLGALQRAFRHHNYAMELESRLRSRKQEPNEPVMSYCYDIIYLCSKVDPAMPEERKVQFIFQNMEPTLMEKVFPQMDRLDIDELYRRLQAHSQAALIAERSTPVGEIRAVWWNHHFKLWRIVESLCRRKEESGLSSCVSSKAVKAKNVEWKLSEDIGEATSERKSA